MDAPSTTTTISTDTSAPATVTGDSSVWLVYYPWGVDPLGDIKCLISIEMSEEKAIAAKAHQLTRLPNRRIVVRRTAVGVNLVGDDADASWKNFVN